VNSKHPAPLLDRHLVERHRPIDTGIAHHRIDATERIERCLHDRFAAFRRVYGVVARCRGSALVRDLLHHLFGHCLVGAVSENGATDVVHDDLSAPARRLQGVEPAQTAACAGDDDDLVVEIDHCAFSP
jgi:hypothetical protein